MIYFVFTLTLVLCGGMAVLSLHSRVLNRSIFLKLSHLCLIFGLCYLLWNIQINPLALGVLLWFDMCIVLGLVGYILPKLSFTLTRQRAK